MKHDKSWSWGLGTAGTRSKAVSRESGGTGRAETCGSSPRQPWKMKRETLWFTCTKTKDGGLGGWDIRGWQSQDLIIELIPVPKQVAEFYAMPCCCLKYDSLTEKSQDRKTSRTLCGLLPNPGGMRQTCQEMGCPCLKAKENSSFYSFLLP